jgi:hypothetical protein
MIPFMNNQLSSLNFNSMINTHMNMVNQQFAQISTFNNLSINNLQNNISSEGNFLFVFYEF